MFLGCHQNSLIIRRRKEDRYETAKRYTAAENIRASEKSPSLGKEKLSQSLWKIAEEYGPIFRFEFPSSVGVFVSGRELAAEVCDEKRFDKISAKPC